MQEKISILKTSQCLYHYVLTDDVSGTRECLNNDVMAWSTRDSNGMTSLMIAATLNRLEIIDVLLTSNCDLNDLDVKGNTALHLAVDEGNMEVVKRLVHCGRCVIDALNHAGESALMRAAFYDYAEVSRTLLKEGGANPEVRNKEGQTALLVALQEGSHMTADVLVKTGCDVNITDNMGRTALYMAIHSPCIKTLECAKLLVNNDYCLPTDKMWILNDEKHNLFYQDDDFYMEIRWKLRHNTTDENAGDQIWSVSTEKSSPPRSELTLSPHRKISSTSPTFAMSPTLKEKIMSPEFPKFTPIPFSKLASEDASNLGSPISSPLQHRRSLFKDTKERFSSWTRPELTSSFSSDSDDSTNDVMYMTGSENQVRKSQSFSGGKTHSTINNALRLQPKVNGCWSPGPRARFVKSASDGAQSAPNSPMIRYKRQVSIQTQLSWSHDDITRRKISLPNKPTVKFSTEIQVFDSKRKT